MGAVGSDFVGEPSNNSIKDNGKDASSIIESGLHVPVKEVNEGEEHDKPANAANNGDEMQDDGNQNKPEEQ